MGAWGVDLESDDTFLDVHGEFIRLYNNGKEAHEITSTLLSAHKDLIKDNQASNNFWFAIAKGQWECKALERDVYERVKDIIEKKNELEVWRELGADESDIRRRQSVLEKFLVQLSVEKDKPRPRKKDKILSPVFEKGDCITFKLLNGNFGAAVILESEKDTSCGYNLVIVTNMNSMTKPAVCDVINARVLKRDSVPGAARESMTWFLPNHFAKDKDKFEVIGKIPTRKIYSIRTSFKSGVADWFIYVIEFASQQLSEENAKWFAWRLRRVKTYL